MFSTSILDKICFETFFGELNVELSLNVNSYMQIEIFHSTNIIEPHYTLVDISLTNCSVEPTNSNLLSLYFDSSRSKDGGVVGCLLIDLHGNQTRLSCHLESKFSNNMSYYEALVKGLSKSFNMSARCIEVFHVSQVVIKQVRNSIGCNSYHLKKY